MEKILVVAAHPDDEALGCGGTMAYHSHLGDDVHVIFLADGVASRNSSVKELEIVKRKEISKNACKILGVSNLYFLEFPDNKLDSIPLLDIIKPFEKLLYKIKPSIVYTHHQGDLNIDHSVTHNVVMTACRPSPNFFVKEIYSFEVLSSTEWASPSMHNTFIPNKFIDISSTIDIKIKSLEAYAMEMRSFPHSRSIETVKALATLRGSSIGISAAESFMVNRIIS